MTFACNLLIVKHDKDVLNHAFHLGWKKMRNILIYYKLRQFNKILILSKMMVSDDIINSYIEANKLSKSLKQVNQ